MFAKLSMQKKFALTLFPILLSSLIVSAFIYKTGKEENTELARALQITHIVGEQELAMVNMSEALRGYLINPKNSAEFERKKSFDEQYSKLAEELGKITSTNPEIKKLNDEMAKLDATTLDEKENKVAELVKTDHSKAVEFYEKEYIPTRKIQNENFIQLKKLTDTMSQKIIDEDKTRRFHNATYAIIFLLGSLIICSFFSLFISRSISNNTNSVLSFFKHTSDNLSEEAVSLLEKSKQLSDSSSLESSAIQETAASLHEITQMAQKTSENAALSKNLAKVSSEKSKNGVETINKMIASIDSINNFQEEFIKVVEDGNKRISEIVQVISNIETKTKVINEIVFQTKLLSFNASVEAARAGEHGKGFSVVAEEIGNLANLSGKASEEINQLLSESVSTVNDIVSSTQSSLNSSMVQSKELTHSGKRIADDCSQVLNEIEKSVIDASSAIDEISVATTEQSRGVSEINSAIEQLDQTVQGNSTIAKDAHSIASNLNSQSIELKQKISNLESLINGRT